MANERSETLKHEAAQLDAEIAAAAIPVPETPSEQGGAHPAGAEAETNAPPPPIVTPEEEALALVEILWGVIEPVYPSLSKIYTDEARARLARAAAPLMQKYNFSVRLAKWQEEIDFAFVALPLALQTVRAIQADNAARALKKPAAPNEAPPAPAAAPDIMPSLKLA